MAKFKKETLTVDGVDVAVYTAGSGEPLVFFHGAGTVDGHDFAEPWTEKFKVIVPYHPGFGESGDDPTFTDLHDYVMHYLNMFDMMKLDRFNLVGLSLGGYLAAKFASEHSHRIKKLALIAPAGIMDEKHPMADILSIPGEQIPGMLVSNFDVLAKRLPAKPDLDFIGDRYRESATTARLLWEHPLDPKFTRHLKRISVPTMIVWGDEDKLIPVQQAETWRKFLPKADIQIFKGAGHLVHLEKPEAVAAVEKFLG
jgi:pimeloyl-ACP methyl ester carboxylesterase